MKHIVITISREYASGGRMIGKMLAEELGIPYYDSRVSELSAEKSGLSAEHIETTEQRSTSSFLSTLYINGAYPSVQDKIFALQSETIRELAEHGSCVIVGRCSNYILRDFPGHLSVFIHAPLEDRVRRAAEEYKVKTPNVKAYVKKVDKARANYHNFYTDYEWGKAHNYDLCINSNIGLKKAVAVIRELAEDCKLHMEK